MGEAPPAGRLTVAGRVAALRLVIAAYAPWWAQRRLHASKAPIRVVVAGRQSGKTHCAAEEVVRVMLRRPGSQSCLLMPTYKSTKGPLKHLRRALSSLGPSGRGGRWRWFEVDKCFRLWNGSELYVRTADDKEGVPTRGLTIDGILWVDEAAYVPREAWDAARLTQAAVANPLVLITTTPCGRNWVFDEFQAGCPGKTRKPLNESFRFRTTDSPYHNPEFVRDLRAKLGARKALQELEAHFLGDAHAAFDPDDLAKMFAEKLGPIRGEQLSLGVDLGKEQDYTVLTLMNEFGEAWVVGRWRDMEWPDQEARIVALAQKHKAIVVLALGAGGGYGGMMMSRLKPVLGEARLLGVRDASLGVRGELCELLIGASQNGRVRVDAGGELAAVCRHELTFFEAHRQISGGVERWRYHGPEGVKRDEDEDNEDHDDCVISLALANWGRANGWTSDGGDGGIASFKPRSSPGGSSGGSGGRGPGRVGGRGYMLR